MNKQVEANLSMVVSKALGGLNMNALKYLLPLWIAPVTGVTFRLVFGAAAFWLIDIFCKPENSTIRQKWQLFMLGALGIYGYMFFYLLGISKTTPVSSSIFVSLEPIWVFIIAVLFYKEKVTWMKVLGIGMGLGGAILCISTQPSDDLASNAPLGNLMCLVSSLVYAVYLILSNRLLKGVGNMTMLKYTFLGAAVMAVIVNTIYGFDAPILRMSLFSTPMLVLLFVLVFPTTISYLLFPLGLKYLKTTLVAIYGYLILIVATVTSFILGQDRFSWTQLAAIVLICASVYLVEVAESKSEKQIISKSR
ncbi:DMT family transporter [Phocaeicola dorei]|uniref:DMT family transporter n=1 Tax=Phocaeicola dorei TaxID=357276 RepID=A0A412ZK17_9BACT|nr:DMT family transporter [Phocaeicola dorei]RGV81291.1 DMT family transporter [Phocaeicola dorei]